MHPGAFSGAGFSDPAFGSYRVLARIGRGGMSDILLALRDADEARRVVVLKVLSASFTTEPAASDMFLDEARVAVRLSHPNIVQTYDVGVFQGSYCIAMEYLRGQPLHRVMQRAIALQKSLPLTVCVSLIVDVLDALGYAHDAVDCDGRALNVVHRDVSPQNLLLQYDGRIKVLDFGIAKASTQESATNAGVIKGKFAYMAPEQARAVPVDRRADLWSVGVVLWELCTGKRLFKCASEAETLQATLYAAVPPIAELRPEVPEELEGIVERALQRDPEGRYASARAMQEDLERWLRSQSQYVRAAPAILMAELFAEERAQQERSVRLLLSRHSDGPAPPSSQ